MDGRVPLVTGGSRASAGRRATAMGEGGHRVVICYRDDHGGAEETAATILATGGESYMGPVEVLVKQRRSHARQVASPDARR